jgi:hypothetical protein
MILEFECLGHFVALFEMALRNGPGDGVSSFYRNKNTIKCCEATLYLFLFLFFK